jgi:hypothetical protein
MQDRRGGFSNVYQAWCLDTTRQMQVVFAVREQRESPSLIAFLLLSLSHHRSAIACAVSATKFTTAHRPPALSSHTPGHVLLEPRTGPPPALRVARVARRTPPACSLCTRAWSLEAAAAAAGGGLWLWAWWATQNRQVYCQGLIHDPYPIAKHLLWLPAFSSPHFPAILRRSGRRAAG